MRRLRYCPKADPGGFSQLKRVDSRTCNVLIQENTDWVPTPTVVSSNDVGGLNLVLRSRGFPALDTIINGSEGADGSTIGDMPDDLVQYFREGQKLVNLKGVTFTVSEGQEDEFDRMPTAI